MTNFACRFSVDQDLGLPKSVCELLWSEEEFGA